MQTARGTVRRTGGKIVVVMWVCVRLRLMTNDFILGFVGVRSIDNKTIHSLQ